MKIDGNPETYYLLGGAVTAFVMAILRAKQFSRKKLLLRVIEGMMCSMLTTALSITVHEYWHISYISAIPIGTFIGFIGTDFIHSLILGTLESYAVNYKKKLDSSTRQDKKE